MNWKQTIYSSQNEFFFKNYTRFGPLPYFKKRNSLCEALSGSARQQPSFTNIIKMNYEHNFHSKLKTNSNLKLDSLVHTSNTTLKGLSANALRRKKDLDLHQDFLSTCFFNQCFDKGRLKNFVLWFLKNYGQKKTVILVEQLKDIGFDYASKAGISLGIDDLKIPPRKNALIFEAENQTTNTIHQYVRGEITGVERFQRLIDTWHRTSEALKQEVIDHFEATDILNPVYMMAFSGARGNVSQVRQLVGMRGLMADPQGQIIDFPIRSNFREGLTLTEYLISSYGARKGIVDTALRTANAGYLTRRLVDVAQHVIISHFDCGTHRGIFLKDMKEGNKTIYSLVQRVVGRILARDLINTSLNIKTSSIQKGEKETDNSKELSNQVEPFTVIARRNQEVTLDLALSILKKFDKVFVRSPLTCETNQLICQLCYGWSLGQGSTLVSIGEAVGVIAAQSIGEPGTQLTMRTFHTGGVFSGDISDQIRAPFNGLVEYPKAIPGTLIRTPEGKIAFFTKSEGFFFITQMDLDSPNTSKLSSDFPLKTKIQFKVPSYTLIYIRNGQSVNAKEVIAQISTISRKTNATDEAALTIESEYEGQFYSKTLSFRERFLGDAKIMEAALNQSRGSKSNPFEKSVFPNLPNMPLAKKSPLAINGLQSIDKIYEAWTWGYAWILSGKIYELNLQGEMCFPKLGDLVNSKSSMNQTQWNLNFNNGPAQLYYSSKKPQLGSKQSLQSRSNLNSQTHLRMKKENLLSNVNVAQPLLFFDVLKIRLHKSIYVLKSKNRSPFLEKNSFGSNIDQNDVLLRMYALRSHEINSSNYNIKTSKKLESKKGKRTLLHWLPNQFQTSTGGSVFFEDLFRSQKIDSDIDHLFQQQVTAVDSLDKFNENDSHSNLFENNTLSETLHSHQIFNPNRFQSKNLKNNIRVLFENAEISNKIEGFIRNVFYQTKENPRSFSSEVAVSKKDSKSYRNKIYAKGLTDLQKESVSMSLKTEFIQKFKTESSFAQKQNESFMNSYNHKYNYSFLKRSKFNESLEEQKLVTGAWSEKSLTLNKDLFKSRAFGMRWKNPYQLFPKVTYNNLIYTDPSLMKNAIPIDQLTVVAGTSNKKKIFNISELALKDNFKTSKKNLKNQMNFLNGDLSLFFNRRLFWIPNQFYRIQSNSTPLQNEELIDNTTKSYLRENSIKSPTLNLTENSFSNPSGLFYFETSSLKNCFFFGTSVSGEKPPLFIQINRQGYLQNQFSSMCFPSLLKSSPYKMVRTNNFNSKFSYMNQSFALKKNWSFDVLSTEAFSYYKKKKSNNSSISINSFFKLYQSNKIEDFIRDLRVYGLEQNAEIHSRRFEKSKSYSAFFTLGDSGQTFHGFKELEFNNLTFKQKSESLNPQISHLSTFCILMFTYEMKQKRTWLSYCKSYNSNKKTELSPFLKPNQQYPQLPNVSESVKTYNIVSNFMKKEIQKTNVFVHKKQLSFYLISLNFQQSINPFLTQNEDVSPYKTFSSLARTKIKTDSGLEDASLEINFKNKKSFKNVNTILSRKDSSLTNIQLKKGWVYFSFLGNSDNTNLVTDLASYHKKIVYPGQPNSLSLNSSIPLYLECVSINDIFHFESFLGCLSKSSGDKKANNNKKCIKNLNSRFILSSNLESLHIKNDHNLLNENLNQTAIFDFKNFKKQNSFFESYLYELDLAEHKDNIHLGKTCSEGLRNFVSVKKKIQLLKQLKKLKSKFIEPTSSSNSFIILLIQPVVESMQKSLKELSTYVDDSSLKFKSNFFTKRKKINHSSSSKRFSSTLIHFSFHSLLNKRLFYSYQFNKQKPTSQPLFKHPTSHIKIIPMSIDRKLEFYNSYQKMSTPYYGSFQSYQRPTNLGPFFITYTRPMGVDYMFKTQNVSLAHQSLSNFDSILFSSLSSTLSSFLSLYIKQKREKTIRAFPLITHVPTPNNTLNLEEMDLTNSSTQKQNLNHLVRSPLADTFINSIPNLVQSPCFSFYHFFQFRNPIFTFENLQKDFFGPHHITSGRSKRLSQKILNNSKKGRCLISSLPNMSSTVFTYNQRNKLFRGIQCIGKTDIYSPFNGEVVLLNPVKGCIVLTKTDLISYYLLSTKSISNFAPQLNSNPEEGEINIPQVSTIQKQEGFNLRSYYKKHKSYPINDILVKFLNMTDVKLDPNLVRQLSKSKESFQNQKDMDFPSNINIENDTFSFIKSSPLVKVSNLIGGQPIDLTLKLRLGDFCFYGDPITETTAIQTSGQLIHFNNQKITLRRAQPIFISPKGILHKFDNDFVDPKTPVITLSYQKLKTGDIIQGIPKVEQFFEARTTKRGRFFRDSLPYLLKTLFKRYRTKLPLDLAVRQSFYKIQQILVDGVHRVYKSQGVSISDKHLEVIVKQMTSKVRIIDGAQTGFFPGEVVDLYFIEKINQFLMKKMTYEPLVLGITKSSLEVDSFLSAASFQQTTRVLSKAALFRKKDFLKGLKENVILGNLIPAGTGFLVYIDL